MDKLEFQNKITEIGSCEDEAKRRELLTQLQEDVSPKFDEIDDLKTKNDDLTKNNDELRDYNMKLFLRVGEQKTPEEIKKSKGGTEPPEKREFKNLFDEKGNIK